MQRAVVSISSEAEHSISGILQDVRRQSDPCETGAASFFSSVNIEGTDSAEMVSTLLTHQVVHVGASQTRPVRSVWGVEYAATKNTHTRMLFYSTNDHVLLLPTYVLTHTCMYIFGVQTAMIQLPQY